MDITQLPSITQLPYTMNTTQTLSSQQFSNKEIFAIMLVSAIIIILSVSVGIYKYVRRESHPRGGKEQTGVSLWFLVRLVC